MATYIYETVPDFPDVPVRRFEIKQSMMDAALTRARRQRKPRVERVAAVVVEPDVYLRGPTRTVSGTG